MRPAIYRQIAQQPEHATPADILSAVAELGGGEHPVTVKAVQKIVAIHHHNNIDETSFHKALSAVVKEHKFTYRLGDQKVTELPEDGSQV